MDIRYKKLAKNSGIMLIGNLSSKLISFLLLPIYTHYLSPEAYGESDVINVYSSIVLAVVTCCVADAMFVFPKQEDEEGKKRYFSSGLTFVIEAFVILGVLLYGLDLIFEIPNGGVLLNDKWWIYLMAFSMFLQQYFQQFTLSLEKTLNYSLAGVVLTVLMTIFAILLLPHYGLVGYLWSIIIANFGAAFFSFFASKSYSYISFKCIDKTYTKKLLAYGIPLIPNSLMWWLVNGLNRPLMETYLGLSAIGVFSVANRFPSVLTMVFQVIGKSMSISVIDEFGKPDFNTFYNRILRVLTMIVLLMGVLLCVFSKLIINIFTDSNYHSSWQYMPLLTLAVIFQCMGSFIGNVFLAEKKSKYFFYSSFWGAITSLILTCICIRYFGLFGACTAIVGSFLAMFLFRVYYAWKNISEFNIKYYVFTFLLYIVLVVIVTMDVSLFFQVSFISIYFLITYVLNKEDIKSFINNLKLKFSNK